jgi:hypothetical protein
MRKAKPRPARGSTRSTSRRRTIDRLVTETSIEEMNERLGRVFWDAERTFPPANDESERERRESVLRRGGGRVLLGALIYLNAHEPNVARSLVHAGVRYARDVIRDGEGTFKVRYERIKDLPDWLFYPGILSMHERNVRLLREAWDESRPMGSRRRASQDWRVGDAQTEGYKRWRGAVERRADAVIGIVDEYLSEPALLDSLGDKMARKKELVRGKAAGWVRKDKTPAKISLRIMELLYGWSPRIVKERLAEARRFMKETKEYEKVLDLRAESPAPNSRR